MWLELSGILRRKEIFGGYCSNTEILKDIPGSWGHFLHDNLKEKILEIVW